MPHSHRLLRLLRPLLITLALGAVGALVNYLLLSPLPSPVFYLGGLAYLPVLLRYGIGYSLLAATLTQLPLLITHYWWLPLPELLALYWLMRRYQHSPMRAAFSYWLSIGLVCSAVISFSVESWDVPTRIFALATPPLAGVALMALSLHLLGMRRARRQETPAPISQQLGNLLVSFACIPVLAFHVLATPHYTRERLEKTFRSLEHSERIALDRFSLLIERNLGGLKTISEMIGTSPQNSLASFEPLINRVLGNLQEVFTIVLIDEQGYARAGAPNTFPDGIRVADAKQFYGDRDYFLEAKQDRLATVSYGIIGRRMNPEPLLSLVAPISNGNQQFAGLVLGNLPLRRLQSVFNNVEQAERLEALIYDRKASILYSTDGLALKPLSALAQQPFFSLLSRDQAAAIAAPGDNLREHIWQGKLLRHVQSEVGGGIVLFFDLRPEIRQLALNSLLTLLVVGGVLISARLLARRQSKQLLAPLLDLHKHLQQMDPARMHRMQPLVIESHTQEINELIRSVNTMMIRMAKSRLETDWAIAEKDRLNADLDRKVAERTDELASKAEALEKLSITDSLTGLHNRRQLNTELNSEWSRTQRLNSRFSLMLFDVDHFKRINDQYGHPVGDEVLRQIGQCLLEKIRGIDIAARYGGEEFAVLLPGIDSSHALVVAERIRLALADLSIDTDQGPLHFTISVGLCDSHSAGLGSEEALLQRVDQALYHAKRNGRNRSIIWSEKLPTA